MVALEDNKRALIRHFVSHRLQPRIAAQGKWQTVFGRPIVYGKTFQRHVRAVLQQDAVLAREPGFAAIFRPDDDRQLLGSLQTNLQRGVIKRVIAVSHLNNRAGNCIGNRGLELPDIRDVNGFPLL